MKKIKLAITAACFIVIIAMNVLCIGHILYSPTQGLNKTQTLPWTHETEEFVHATFGHYETDVEKTVAFKQWIIENIRYEPYAMPFIQNIDVDKVLAERKGICFEQASLFTIFCRIEGIECYNVDGRAKHNWTLAHSWNRYQIDGQWYEIDITHDQTALEKGKETYGIKKIDGLDAPDVTFDIYRKY